MQGSVQDFTASSGASTSGPVTLGGTFTSAPAIVSVTAANAGSNVGLGASDTLTIVFDQNTNRAGFSNPMNTAAVASLLSLSSGTFGSAELSGSWSSDTTLVVTFGPTMTGASVIPKTSAVTVVSSVGVNLLSKDGSSAASTSGPVTVGGTFTSAPALVSVVASNSGNNVGAGARDTLVLTFDQSTNGGNAVNKLDVSELELGNLLSLSGGSAPSLGTSYRGAWDASRTTLTITVGSDVTGIQLVPGVTAFTVKSAGNLQDSAVSSGVSTSGPITLTGTLTSAPAIVSATAFNTGSGVGINNGDKIVIIFNQGTNRAGLSSSITKLEVAGLLSLSGGDAFGAAYTGTWSTTSSTDDTLTITLSDASGAALTPKVSTISVQGSALLKDSAGTSDLSTSSRVLSGTLTSAPAIVSVVAVNNAGHGPGPDTH
jgi:hypothetical protein